MTMTLAQACIDAADNLQRDGHRGTLTPEDLAIIFRAIWAPMTANPVHVRQGVAFLHTELACDMFPEKAAGA
jgi:hypothetical protein